MMLPEESINPDKTTVDEFYPDLKELFASYKRDVGTTKIIIITDRKVWDIWGNTIKGLIDGQLNYGLWIGPEGELLKSLDQYSSCVTDIIQKTFHRSGRILAIGGGSVSDFAGFVAATILRGVEWDIIPTSLLSLVDASIGGKVGLNLNIGKNLLGSFYLPTSRRICASFLTTLPEDELKSGYGEVIKYAFLSKNIYLKIVNKDSQLEIIKSCCEYKNQLVKDDFYEHGRRRFLNLGHTFGHGLEKLLKLPHGISVILGMEVVFQFLSKNSYLIEKLSELKRIFKIDVSLLDFSGQIDSDMLLDLLKVDKKRVSESTLSMVLCHEIGTPFIREVDYQEIQRICARLQK